MLLWVFVGVAVMGVGGEVSEGGPHSPLRKDGSYWQQVFSPSTSHSTNNMDGDAYNPASDSHNYNTSLLNQGSFFSIVNQNGNMYKLLKNSIGTGVMDRVMNYFFEKMGTRRSRSFGTTYLADQNNHQPHANWFHGDKNTYTWYEGEGELRTREPVKAPNRQASDDGACIDVYTSFHSSSLCLDVSTAIAIAALAVLLQIFFSFSVESLCPASNSFGNFDDVVFSIRNANNITVEADGGNQMQAEEQFQEQLQHEDQNQQQDEHQLQIQTQSQHEQQDQNQNQGESQTNTQTADITDNSVEDERSLKEHHHRSARSGNTRSPFPRSGPGHKPVKERVKKKMKNLLDDQEGGNDSRGFGMLASMRAWSMWPMWQEMAKSFTESRFFPKRSLCPALRGFVSG
ncbi:uncharacterized protein [Procambarus clarkii]|uniref:uncharacterized protein n=1 Tax=Procambarus clarkii TaxID=6728 RepID=UPI003743B9FB